MIKRILRTKKMKAKHKIRKIESKATIIETRRNPINQ